MILEVLRGEGGLRNRSYRWGRTYWLSKMKSEKSQKKGEAAFTDLNGDFDRNPRPTKAWASWISQETWQLAGRRAALHWSQRVSAREVRQAQKEFQRSLRCNRQKQVKEVGEAIEYILVADQKQEAWKRISSRHRQATGGHAPPSREHLDQISTEWTELYRCRTPEGLQDIIMVMP